MRLECLNLFFLAVSSLLLAVVCTGCGGPKYPYATVTGRVTIDGAAVPKGYISFSPTAGPGAVVGAPIDQGVYRCEKVPQGKLNATFIAQAAEPTTVFDKVNNCTHEVPKDILPPSCQAGRECNVAAGTAQLDFDLKGN